MSDSLPARRDDAYARLNEATIFAEAFNQLIAPEDTGAFFLNVAHHFLNFRTALVLSLGSPAVTLARRGIDSAEEQAMAGSMTAEHIEEMRHKVRLKVLPAPAGVENSIRIAVPFVYGGDLVAFAVLQYDRPTLGDDDSDILRVLGRAAGSALGRIIQAQKIEAERDYAEAIFHSMVSPIINVDTRGVIVKANEAALQTLGADIIGRPYGESFGFMSFDPVGECLRSGIAQHRVDAASRNGVLWGLTVSPLTVARKTIGVIAGFRDLSSLDSLRKQETAA
ncbi:MAG: PAS domain-containing protein [Candidatus Hydrogenedentota bacterium]